MFHNLHLYTVGMVVSNEPGYYEPGNFGIRIENLLLVVEKPQLGEFGGRKFYGFERLTHIPIQTKLIALELLSASDIEWLNHYHDDVRKKILPLLRSDEAKLWLEMNTKPIVK
jgi:Xaa-Pro aminopeptidase